MCGSGLARGFRAIQDLLAIHTKGTRRHILMGSIEFCGEAVGQRDRGRYAIPFATGIIPMYAKSLQGFAVPKITLHMITPSLDC
jgi:hypothetical protein